MPDSQDDVLLNRKYHSAVYFLFHRRNKMKSRSVLYAIVLFLFLAFGVGGAHADYDAAKAEPLAPLGSAFTYQGQLKNSAGQPITNTCNFFFKLNDAETGGAQVGPFQEKIGVNVNRGLFTVVLDFTNAAFSGDACWLEVAVKCNGDPSYTTLAPRQPLNPTPYAVDADMLDGWHAAAFSGAGHIHWGQTWTGTGTGLTLAGGTTGIAGGGSTYGIYGVSGSPTGAAGYFTNTSGSGTFGRGWGVRTFTGSGIAGDLHPLSMFYPGAGEFAGPNGVIGSASNDSSDGYGVIGISAGLSGRGVNGYASNTTGNNYGVYGTSLSSVGQGVYGLASSATGINYGVFGQSTSTSGTGVYGFANSATGSTYGVYGRANSISGTGVYGFTPDVTGSGTGVEGYTEALAGFGLRGTANNNADGAAAGVYGRGDSNIGFGVAGHNFWGGAGVGAWSYSGNLIEARSGDYPGGTLRFYVTSTGTVYADGGYGIFSTSSLDGETHATSSIQSTEVWVEDFGNGSLKDGTAVINIAPDFTGMANLSVDYMVFVTLEGDCQGVYITNKTATTFEVHELNGGTSNVSFGYRIVAKQSGSETLRLPKVTIPATVEVVRQADEPATPLNPPQPMDEGQSQGQVQP
jgi:hypothetical protein